MIHNLIYILLFWSLEVMALTAAPIDRKAVPGVHDLLSALDESNAGIKHVLKLRDEGNETGASKELMNYLQQQSADRYYFDWKQFGKRFESYRETYPDEFDEHRKMVQAHMSRFGPETKWILPFRDLKGVDVTPYELRHLARQQKSADITLMYYYENRDAKYLDYFIRQVANLNQAFKDGAYDDAGNGIYESYRAGKRVHNWLFNHHAYLASEAYSWEDQLLLIRTFLHHGAQLQWRTRKNSYGNHHTKGLVALFEIATIFSEFTITEEWRKQAIDGLVWHITHEINEDGFQFERSVHYHMGDIENYFRVYELARINRIVLPDVFVTQFRKMFSSLVALAQPNRRLPVLQDDTDSPYEENNDVSGVMTIGTLLFSDPVFRYFAGDDIPASVYWLLRDEQLTTLENVQPEKPLFGSSVLEETGYYVMRNGWDKNDLYMTITAGLSDKKPDHQHGDMLGLVACAGGIEILPNYQVRYKDEEFPFLKNSWAKNVALADSVTLGRHWKPNEGGSGFGKWEFLAKPEIINWYTDDQIDYFCGSHNGFDTVGVPYSREVLFVKDGFWMVRDNFISDTEHEYQQVWQGHFDAADGYYLKRFKNGSGIYLSQLAGTSCELKHGRFRDKSNSVFSCRVTGSYSFTTLLVPRSSLDHQEQKWEAGKEIRVGNWTIHSKEQERPITLEAYSTHADIVLNSDDTALLFGASGLSVRHRNVEFSNPVSVLLKFNSGEETLQILGPSSVIPFTVMDDQENIVKQGNLKPGDVLNLAE